MKFCLTTIKENQRIKNKNDTLVQAQVCRQNVGKFMIQEGIFGHEILEFETFSPTEMFLLMSDCINKNRGAKVQ